MGVNIKKCVVCKDDKKITDFYMSYHPLHEGKVPACKSCIKDMVDIEDINSLKKMLRMIDKPFIPHLWESAKTKQSVIGEYFKLINAKDYRYVTWGDSVNNDESISDNIEDASEYKPEKREYSKKWMGEYTPSEIEYLEEYLTGLYNDYKVRTVNHKDYARKIAKASLIMDRAYQDVLEGKSGSEKRYKEAKDVFDTLSKSAQFSENTRSQNDVGLGGFGKVFEKVEEKRYIPVHTPLNPDDIDKLIEDFKHIFKSL